MKYLSFLFLLSSSSSSISICVVTAAMSTNDPSKNWNPRKILDLDPMAGNFTCVGSAPTKGNVRCRCRIDVMACAAAVEILDEMTAAYMVRHRSIVVLFRLAQLLLCENYHQHQAKEKAQEWFLKAQESAQAALEWSETRAENKSLQKERKELVERVTLLEQDLAKGSERSSQASKKITNLEKLAAVPADGLTDLQMEHAALEEKLKILQKNYRETKETNEALCQQFSKMGEEAQEREAELKRKLLEAEQIAQEREVELRDKLFDAKKKAQHEEAMLKMLSAKAQQAQEKMMDLSKKLLEAEQRAQEAQDGEAELTNKLFKAEQEAQKAQKGVAELNNKLFIMIRAAKDREAKLGNKFSETEQEAQDREADFSNKYFQIELEAQNREAKLSSELFKQEQEAHNREAKLINKLFHTEQEAQDKEAELSDKLFQMEQEAWDSEAELISKFFLEELEVQVREAEVRRQLTDSENLLKRRQEDFHALQLKFEELSQSMITKEAAHDMESEAHRSTILLLQTQLRSQESNLEENRTRSHEKSRVEVHDSQAQVQEVSISSESDCTPAK